MIKTRFKPPLKLLWSSWSEIFQTFFIVNGIESLNVIKQAKTVTSPFTMLVHFSAIMIMVTLSIKESRYS